MTTDTSTRGAVYVYSASTLTVRSMTAIQLVKLVPETQPPITIQPQHGVATQLLPPGIYKVLPEPLPDGVALETGPHAEAPIFILKDPPPGPRLIDQFRRIFGDPEQVLNQLFPPVPKAKSAPDRLAEPEPASPPATDRGR